MGLLPDAQHVHLIAVPSNRDGLRLAIGEARALIGNGERGLEIFSGENPGDRHRRDYQEARENRQADGRWSLHRGAGGNNRPQVKSRETRA